LTKRDGRQTNECRASLDKILPILNCVLAKQFEIDEKSFNPSENNPGQEDKFQDFGSDTLTAREQEVVQLILVGHSSNSVSLLLGISLTTVKTHRRNIYNKLQISSQAELFSLFLLYLK
ncbi:MAG: helix-turn-helix transcriptional regulator, partial [Amylibacter sp.]